MSFCYTGGSSRIQRRVSYVTHTEKLFRAQGDTQFKAECLLYTTFESFVAFSDFLYEADCFAQLYMNPGDISASWSLR